MTALALPDAPRMLEREVEHLCDRLVEQHSGRVVRYSQARATKQTAGIADREYYVLGARIRFEVKASDGKLSAEQLGLLEMEYRAGAIVCVGGIEELAELLIALRRSSADARRIGWLFVRLWAARGLRGKKRTQSTT